MIDPEMEKNIFALHAELIDTLVSPSAPSKNLIAKTAKSIFILGHKIRELEEMLDSLT